MTAAPADDPATVPAGDPEALWVSVSVLAGWGQFGNNVPTVPAGVWEHS